MYEIEITAEGLRHLNKLPEKVRNAALESIFGPISDNPKRLGKPLVGELEGTAGTRTDRADRAQPHDRARFVRETNQNGERC